MWRIVASVIFAGSSILFGQCASGFNLHFPLPNRTAYTASINSVKDHSVNSSYTADGIVITFTGERGDKNGSNPVTINNTPLYAYQNTFGINFIVNGQYTGAGTENYLNYDGHPGIDYKTTDQAVNGQIPVYAAASGTIKPDPGNACCNALYIDHGNGYTTHYLHLSSWTRQYTSSGTPVNVGDQIGISGSIGAPGGPHLHFEVKCNGIPVDPYGWQGRYLDPGPSRSTNLWAPVRSASPNALWHPDGTLVSSNGTVYLVSNGQLRGIPSQSTFYAYGFDFAKVITVSNQEVQQFPQGPLLQPPPSPFLVNDNGTIYEVTDRGVKRGISSTAVLSGQGFRSSDAVTQSTAGIATDAAFPTYSLPYREGSILCPIDSSGHNCAPGSTLYVVSDGKSVPIATASAFASLGYLLSDAIPVATVLLCPGVNCATFTITDTLITSGGTNTLSVPSNPSPLNNATQVSTSPTLQWTGNGTTYDVALGVMNPPTLLSTGFSGSTYAVTGPLQPGTTYYWYVIAHSGTTSVQSPIWQFTVVGNQINDSDVTRLANTTQGVQWFYIQHAGRWYIVSNDGQGQVLALAGADRSYDGIIKWRPINNASARGYPTAGSNLSVTLSTDGKTISFGPTNNTSDADVLSLANSSNSIAWYYVNNVAWYIVEGGQPSNPPVLKLQDADPSYDGVILWKPISNWPIATGQYSAQSTHFSFVTINSNGGSIQFGSLQ